MPAVNRTTGFFDDGITPSFGRNFGPFTVTGMNRLLRVTVSGTVIYQPQHANNTTSFIDDIAWGVQWVVSGNSPHDVISDANDPAWLAWQAHAPQEIDVVWAPFSADYGAGSVGPISLERRGQFSPASTSMDFYFSTGFYFSGPTAGWCTSGSIEIIYLA